ncbi:hypothetical protein GCM10010967_34940 [Dyadobacter beijingensis]|uniref:Secretion system C-terminal sorting domain-containing protein n=1 Tax=Dyadobacter beijingensis TaxID=365489 RepID=A0ABQ2I1Z6_9BACT|nr:FG-GAP-like repeat-containing protein [Dyadobacter beijingensis]GGM98140.1 hypothetical protein GCM10010967_34940 [Dyadobacter beijingensis]
MKHTYKSMLIAAMALAVGSAGYLTTDLWRNHPGSKEIAVKEEIPGVPQSAIERIKEQIAKQEYHISYDEATQTLQSPNRKQNLRAYYKPGQLTVQNRVDSAGHNFKLHLVNDGIYADGKKILSARTDAEPSNKENKLEIDHDGFTEEFINTEDGVRQNFIVSNAPEDTRNLQVRLSAKGLKAQNGARNEIRFYHEDTNGKVENFLVYSDLHCWDANKKPLDATLAYVNDHVEINVAVDGAAYPVTIDPILANGNPNDADKTIELDHSNAWLGFSVSSAGDVNKDGYSDVIVGAPLYDWNGVDAGVAYVFPGSANGLGLNGQRLNRNQALAQMGYSVASAGDVNKDGYSDVIVGSPYWEDGQNNEGAAFLYYGGPVDPVNAPIGINPGNFTILQPDQADAGFGVSVALAGDVNADGYSDFLVGAHMYDKDQLNEGVAFLYYGGNGGPNLAKTEILDNIQSGAMFGYAVAGAGDVNADGASDIIIGARLYTEGELYEGAAFVYLGSINSTPVIASQPLKIQINQPDARLGHVVSTAGDVNGDGYADIAIGAYMFDNGLSNEGAVYVHLGGQNGINPNPHKIIEGEQLEAQFGWSIASAGDVNGDGYGDILVGSRFFSNGQNHEGAVFIYQGSSLGLNATPVSKIESNQGDGWLGSAVAGAGDVNGDGYSDIIIGCYTYDHGQNDEGQVYIYHGKPGNIGPLPKAAGYSSVSGSLAGSSVSNAGDINGDGLEDMIVGAPNFDQGQVGEGAAFISYGDAATGTVGNISFPSNEINAHLGCSVSGAGDTNGDGYDDVIIGASGAQNGVNVGAAYIILGGPQGIASAPSKTLYAANQGFGISVSDAGDINRDGYDDVIVGAPFASKSNPAISQCGAVFVYLGSANGVISPGTIVYSGIAGAKMGNSLDNAGDVNGDGFNDIIAGASQANIGKNKEGAAFIWYGNIAGIPSNTPWSNSLSLDQADAEFGTSVSGAGDVNGDGYGDVIVGAPKHDNGQSDEGVASVFYGSNGGCSIGNKTLLDANQSNASFGKSVGGFTDVNGDGYDDVVVGAPQYDGLSANGGGVWVFHGSPGGIVTSAAFSTTGAQVESHMGESVSGAGDLNGDGYGDILVGIPGYDQSGITNGGVTWAYFGNDGATGKNKRNNIRLYNTNLTTVMTASQTSQNNAGVSLYPTSFLGRNNGRLLWSWAQHGTAFTKPQNAPMTNSTASDGAQASYMSLSGSEMKNLINKQWSATRVRVRIKYELATALTGQVYSPWRYVPEYLLYVPVGSVPELVGEEVETAKILDKTPEYRDIISVYPNPVSERLFIKTDNADQIKSLQLISSNGSTALTSTRPQTELDVKHLTPGTYILMINRKDGTQTSHRVLIKK